MVCNLCPRGCGADRESTFGFCGVPRDFVVARAAKHFWEEPPISGEKGSGTVFFSGCSLGCAFCQNYEISHGKKGKTVTDKRLMEIFDELAVSGVHNINLVNPTHYSAFLLPVMEKYQKKIPFVYNSSGYERTEILTSLEKHIDIYLPDLKYISDEKSQRYSACKDYFAFASKALEEMKRQRPVCEYDENGIMQRGMIVRHLILPKNTNQSIEILRWIKANLGEDTPISLMSQYTPYGKIDHLSEIQRPITEREYEKVLNEALSLGFETIFTQSPSSADENFIPDFDFSGV